MSQSKQMSFDRILHKEAERFISRAEVSREFKEFIQNLDPIPDFIFRRWINLEKESFFDKNFPLLMLSVGSYISYNGFKVGKFVKGLFLVYRNQQLIEVPFENNRVIISVDSNSVEKDTYWWENLRDNDVILGFMEEVYVLSKDGANCKDPIFDGLLYRPVRIFKFDVFKERHDVVEEFKEFFQFD